MELCSLADVFGDLVIYRDLNAVDSRLPRYAEIWHEIGMDGPIPPRKLDMAYARALERLLTQAQDIARPHGRPLSEILYLGDNLSSDGGAFLNLRALTGWPGWCLIAVERDEEALIKERDGVPGEGVYEANRWIATSHFLRKAKADGAALDERTVVLVDIDKTAIGARGRNDKSIDRARVAAIEATLADAIGVNFNESEFRQAYAALNTARYHPFTADNQDNLAYVCLMIGAGMVTLDELVAQIADGRLKDCRELMAQMDARAGEMPPGARTVHEDVYRLTLAGDLTPFKAFRVREYQETVSRMGHLPDEAQLAQRLLEEICATREVLEASEWLKGRGCLMVALSDKPDEATAPSPNLAAQGYLPLHRTPTHVIGQSLVLEGIGA
jgi:hypothetical protein